MQVNSDFSVAVHALVFLNHKGCVLSSEELAENICTNAARVRKVTARLKKAGMLTTKEGSVGGCCFRADPAAITLAHVAEALGVRFVETGWHSGRTDCDCKISASMGPVMDSLLDDLNARCLERLGQISIADLDRHIFLAPCPDAENHRIRSSPC